MATTVEQLVVEITADLDAAKSAVTAFERQLEDLQNVEVTVEAEVEGQRDVEEFIDSLEGLEGDTKTVVLALEAANVERQLTDIASEIRELSGTGVDITAQITGANQLEGDLERIQSEIKEINATEISPDVDTTVARSGVDDLSDSARGANNALANMVGNATQDIGALGGVAGSAGVAIGQMAEFASDAALGGEKLGAALLSMAKVAGPIAAITIAIQAVSEVLDSIHAEDVFKADQVEKFSAALREGTTFAQELHDTIAETGELPFLDNVDPSVIQSILQPWKAFGKETENLIPAMSQLGVSTEAFFRFLDDPAAFQAFIDGLEAQGLISADNVRAIQDLTHGVEQYRDIQGDAAAAQEVLNSVLKITPQILSDATRAFVKAQDPIAQFPEEFQRIGRAIATGFRPTVADIETVTKGLGISTDQALSLGAQAWEEYGQAVDANAEKLREAEERQRQFATAVGLAQAALAGTIDDADALAAALDRVNQASELDFSLIALDTVESFDTIKTAISEATTVVDDWTKVDFSPESVKELRNIPDELAAVTEAVAGMRDSIQTELAAAFETGGIEGFTDKVGFFRREIRSQFLPIFTELTGDSQAAQEKVRQLFDELGLLPRDVRIAIRLTREEEARAALDAFSNVISQMPDNVQVQINTAIAQGDIQGALTILNEQLINRGFPPIVLPVDADTAAANAEIDNTANPRGRARRAGIIAETDTRDADSDLDDTAEPRGRPRTAPFTPETDTRGVRTDLDDTASENRPRVAPIAAQALNVSLVDQVLALLAHTRTAFIIADALTSSAEAELNETARTRFAPIIAVPGGFVNGEYVEYGPGGVNPFVGGRAGATAAPINANVTVNTAVVGNRFDVARVVVRSTTDALRIAGARTVLAGSR